MAKKKPTRTSSKKNAVWLSFDLGIQGDYESLYSWLDARGAKECGDYLAFFNFHHTGDLVSDLKAELGNVVEVDRRAKIYAIYLEPTTLKMKGKFLFGGRKSAPWAGYSPKSGDEEDHA